MSNKSWMKSNEKKATVGFTSSPASVTYVRVSAGGGA